MIIVEIGLNHLGKTDFVEEYINTLIKTEVDAITFQVREPEFYNAKWKGYDLKLSESVYLSVKNKIQSVGKKFGIALGDANYLPFFESIDTNFYKVIRNDITNLQLIEKLKSTGKEVIVSTGLSSEEDIDNFIVYVGDNKNFKLNHTQLSHLVEDCNLSAIDRMKSRYGLNVSFGSHCDNHNVLYMSLNYNPSDILFYVKLDQYGIIFPDDAHAILLQNVDVVVKNLKLLPLAFGKEKKQKMVNKIGNNHEKSNSSGK